MRPRRDPVPRAKEAWWWLGGLLTLGIVGGAVVAAGIALWENIDIRQLAPALQETSASVPGAPMQAPSAKAATPFGVVLLESGRNAGYFPDSTFYPGQLRRWARVTAAAGGVVRTVSDVDGLRGVGADEVLLMPEAPCLSPDELAVVRRHLARGGSVVTNWAFGVRDGACEWRGWQALLDLTGAEAIREISGRDALFFTVSGGLPGSPGIDPGSRVELRPDPAIALRMPGARIYWSDWALNPDPDSEGAGADVAVSTTTTPQGGRVTWFGVRHGQAVTAVDSVRLERVLENGIRWAGGSPHAAASPWPGAAQAALVFAVDVEGRDAGVNARDVATMFRLEELPVSFYVVSRLVQDDERLAEALTSAGEVGTQTVDHAPLAGLTRQDQTIRLRRSYADVEEWTGTPSTGLHPPEESVDAYTLEAWARAGGSYVLASNEARAASPEVHETEHGPVVLVPRLVKDDYTVIVRDVTLRSQRLADALVAGTRKIRAIGGLAVVAGHTQIIESGPRLEAVRTVADSVRGQGGWWTAEAREVADWWLDRSRVGLRWAPAAMAAEGGIQRAMEEDLLVWIGEEPGVGEGAGDRSEAVDRFAADDDGEGLRIDELWVDVVAPTLPQEAIPLVDGVSVDFIETDWGMRVRVGTVRAGEARRVSFVTVDEETVIETEQDGAA